MSGSGFVRLDCGLLCPSNGYVRVTWISTHPHHCPEGKGQNPRGDNRNNCWRDRRANEDTRNESVDGEWRGDVWKK